jgi:cystathionine beta-lyase
MAMAMAEAASAAATALTVSTLKPKHKFESISFASSHSPTSQSLARFSTMQSRLVLNSSREFANTIKIPASALRFATKAVSTSMEEVAEGDAIWDDDLTADKELHVSTQLQQLDNPFDPYGALSTPLYQTATFKQPSATEGGPYDYTRSGNPTRDALERTLARLEGADRAFCFTTGMAALATITRLAEAGQEIVAGDDIYGGSDRLLTRISPKSGLIVKRVDTADLDAVRAAVGPKTRLVWLESPTNPRQLISDIREISKIAHEHGALVIVDNSIMSPILSKPISLGADIVMHSATKFIAGHSDVMAGVLAVKGESLAKEIYFLQNAEGTGLSPFDCWLCLRGIKTMALRVEKQQANAQKIAEYLVDHPLITRVNYAGLPKHTGRDLHYSQCKGAGSVFSFNTGSLALSKHVVEQTKLFSITVSFGSVKSLISLPCFMSHASIPADVREARGLTEDLIRISVGIEDVDDLIADLDQALRTAPK